MAAKKKTTQKRSNTAKSKTGTLKSFKLKPWHIAAGIALFIVGGFIVAFSRAARPLTTYPTGDVIASYNDDSGVLIQEADGTTIKTIVAPSDYTLSSTGDLYCYDANANLGTTKKLNQNQIDGLMQAIKATGIANPPAAPEAIQSALVLKGLTYTDPTTNQPVTYTVIGDSPVPQAFSQSAELIKAACANGSQAVRRVEKPLLKNKNLPQTTTPTTSFNVLRALTQTAHAATINQWSQAFDVYMLAKVNAARASAQVYPYGTQACLQRAAQDWSKHLADLVYNGNGGVKYFNETLHNQSLFADMDAHGCSSATATRAGENIGWDFGSTTFPDANASATSMFNRYMNSTGHRANILSTQFNRWHVGSALSNDGRVVFNTQRFITVPASYDAKK